jgi:hypothetical protein
MAGAFAPIANSTHQQSGLAGLTSQNLSRKHGRNKTNASGSE